MKAKDFIHEQVAARNVTAAIPTVDVNGDTVDLKGFNSCLFTAILANSLDTLSASVYIEFEVEESVDGSTWTDVADADLSDTVTGNNTGTFGKAIASTVDPEFYQTEYKGGKRYVRCVMNVTGTHTNGTPVQVLSQKLGPAVAPQ